MGILATARGVLATSSWHWIIDQLGELKVLT